MAKKKRIKRGGKAPVVQNISTNWADVALAVVNGIFGLFNSNKVFPAFFIIILGICAFVIWRLPETELAPLIRYIIDDVIATKGGLIAALVITNLVWAYVVHRMRITYGQEIDRLAAVRSRLMHEGTPDHEGNVINKHRSSNDDTGEHYILPGEPSA